MDRRGGSIKNFRQKLFCLTVPKNFLGKPFCAVFQKSSKIQKNLWTKGRRRKGVSHFSVKSFLSHSAEKLCRGTFLCFRNIHLPKTVRDKRGVGYHDFLSKLFCLIIPKNFVGEPFRAVFQIISGSEKLYGTRRGEYQDFPSKIVCLKKPKSFVGETFRLSLISGTEKLYASDGYVTIFRQKSFVSHYRKIS